MAPADTSMRVLVLMLLPATLTHALSTGILYWCAMEEMGIYMPADLNPLGGPSPRSVYDAFSGTPVRENTACHVGGINSDNVLHTFSNGTVYANNVGVDPPLPSTPFDINPTGCLVSRPSCTQCRLEHG